MSTNYTLKLSLTEAVTVRTALNEYQTILKTRLEAVHVDDMPGTRAEYVRVETILRNL